MGGSEINVAITSPPYASQRKYDESSGFKPIPPDEYVEWFDNVQSTVCEHLADDGSWFVNIKEHCEDGQRVLYVKDLTLAHVRRWGWRFVDEFCWAHGGTPKGPRQRFKNGWEPVLMFAKGRHKFTPNQVRTPTGREGSSNNGAGGDMISRQGGGGSVLGENGADRATNAPLSYPSNVLSVGFNREAVGHSAAFPVALPDFFIRAYSDRGDAIYDPFMGSGSTLIAADKTGRRCFGMELSPAYCDVIVTRFANATGEAAVKWEG